MELKKWYQEYDNIVRYLGIQPADIWNYGFDGFERVAYVGEGLLEFSGELSLYGLGLLEEDVFEM